MQNLEDRGGKKFQRMKEEGPLPLKAGKSRANANNFSTFSMKYKAQSLLKIMRDALVREKSKKGGEGNSHSTEKRNSKQYYRSTQSPSKTQELTDMEVKKARRRRRTACSTEKTGCK